MAFLRIKAKKNRKSHSETPLLSFWVAQKHEKTPFSLSESLRSTKKLHLVFPSRSEARKNSIWSFWVAQKHKKTPFGLSESLRSIEIYFFHTYVVDRNDYFLFFALMSLTETIIFSFSCLCRWQKRLFSLFCAYVVDRNTYFLFFILMSLTEAIIFSFSRLCRWQKRLFFSICSFWNVQKHEKPPFALSETFRSIKILFLAFLKRSEAWKQENCLQDYHTIFIFVCKWRFT